MILSVSLLGCAGFDWGEPADLSELSATQSKEINLLSKLTCCLVRTILPKQHDQLEVIETANHLPSCRSLGLASAGQIVLWSSVGPPRHSKVVELTC